MKIQCVESCERTKWCSWLAFAWIWILLVAAYDMHFAWTYRTVFASWELNPLVVWAMRHFGLALICVFKLAGLALTAGLVWHCRRRRMALARYLTAFALAVHGGLAALYVIGHQQATQFDVACRDAALRQAAKGYR